MKADFWRAMVSKEPSTPKENCKMNYVGIDVHKRYSV
jgi:hypothetical protein